MIGDGVEQRPCGSIEPCDAGEDGIADRFGHVGHAGAEHLHNEERIAARPLVQLVSVDASGLGQSRHRFVR